MNADAQAPWWASRLRLAEGAALALVAIACLAFQLRLPSKAVAEGDYEAVANVLRQESRPGDAVLLHPWWTERARIFVPEGLPVVGFQGSDAAPLTFHPRVWVLDQPSMPRAGASEFEAAFAPGRTELGAERRFGNLSLRLFENGRARAKLFSAAEVLAQASVYLEGPDGARQPCAWTGRSFRCPHAEVAVGWHELNFEPRRCIRLVPPGGAARVVAEFQNVPAAETLDFFAGYTWERGYWHDTVGDADMGFEVNGVTQPLPMPQRTVPLQHLEARGTPAGATVRVFSHAQDPNGRELCFEVYGLGGRP